MNFVDGFRVAGKTPKAKRIFKLALESKNKSFYGNMFFLFTLLFLYNIRKESLFIYKRNICNEFSYIRYFTMSKLILFVCFCYL